MTTPQLLTGRRVAWWTLGVVASIYALIELADTGYFLAGVLPALLVFRIRLVWDRPITDADIWAWIE